MMMQKKWLLIFALAVVVLLYTLTLATDSESLWADYFWSLVLLCMLLVVALLLMILRFVGQMLRDRKDGVFGVQISKRLSRAFTLVAVVPALFLLIVSAQFISVSINSWFSNDTEIALERSLEVSKSALSLSVESNLNRAHALWLEAEKNERQLQEKVEKAFEQWAVWDSRSQTLLMHHNPKQLTAPSWDIQNIALAREVGESGQIIHMNGVLYTQGWLKKYTNNNEERLLFFRHPVSQNIAEDAILIEMARAKYAERIFAQQGLQTFFLITLLLAALLAILLALATALGFARRFVEPILALSSGARAVAEGDFSQRIVAHQKDELGKLVMLFNDMTDKLEQAQQIDAQHREELEAARHYLERVLDNLSAGVVTLNANNELQTFNQAAQNILKQDLRELIGFSPQQWQAQSPEKILLTELFSALLNTEHDNKAIQIAYTAGDESRILFGKAVRLPEENGSDSVLLFDDITLLAQAQKEAAWGEIAKRLAHEIRNPLTPIQLSAERLAWKLSDKLNETDVQILNKSTDTIIKQVGALKEMVETFRNYARATAMRLEHLNLNQLIEEVLVLYESNPCHFQAALSEQEIWVQANATAMRQVLHNLFKNAAEAAENDSNGGQVWIESRLENEKAVLNIANNGNSFSKTMLVQAFEPYLTDKVGGTGLGLPVVKKIIEEHKGSIQLSNRSEGGALVEITLPATNSEHHNA